MADIDVTRTDRAPRRGEPTLERTGFRMSWGAIIAGLVVATVLQVVLGLLGLGIGLAWWDAGDPVQTLGIGAGVWAAMSMLIALFIGGATTGRLAGILTTGDGALHGVVVWGLSVIVTVFMVTSGVGVVMGGTMNLAQSPLAATVFEERRAEIEREIDEMGEAVGEAIDDPRLWAEDATDRAAQGAWWALLAMGLGLGAAIGGASMTARE